MAKFFKSIFHTTSRRKAPHYNEHAEADDERSETPPQTARRQLSISRSGRMRQANKKRHSLTLELYGEAIQIDAVEKQQAMEYHVNTSSHTAPAVLGPRKSRFGSQETEEVQPREMDTSIISDEFQAHKNLSTVGIDLAEVKSLEKEIDLAFEILDKS